MSSFVTRLGSRKAGEGERVGFDTSESDRGFGELFRVSDVLVLCSSICSSCCVRFDLPNDDLLGGAWDMYLVDIIAKGDEIV